MTEHRIIYVECCYGLLVRPAHGCRTFPVCVCGWIGDRHTSHLEANLEGNAHVLGTLPETSIEVSGYWGYGQETSDE